MTEEVKNIVLRALGVYLKFGIKSITMADMARELGMSKKTLYKYVEDKNDLVEKALELQCEMEREQIECICQVDQNAIDESYAISKYISGVLKNLNPSVHYDLEKYHRDAFERTHSVKQQEIFNCIIRNTEKGQTEGLYRKEINAEIITKLYLSKVDVLFDGNLFPPDKFTFVQVNEEFFEYHVRGIATQKGIEYLEEKLKNNQT